MTEIGQFDVWQPLAAAADRGEGLTYTVNVWTHRAAEFLGSLTEDGFATDPDGPDTLAYAILCDFPGDGDAFREQAETLLHQELIHSACLEVSHVSAKDASQPTVTNQKHEEAFSMGEGETAARFIVEIRGTQVPTEDGGLAFYGRNQAGVVLWTSERQEFVGRPQSSRDGERAFLEALRRRNGNLPAAGAEGKPRGVQFPTRSLDFGIPQSPEIRAMGEMTAHGRDPSAFTFHPDTIQAVFSRKGLSHKVVIDCSPAFTAAGAMPWSVESELRRNACESWLLGFGVGRDDLVHGLYALVKLINAPTGAVDIGVSELLHLEGKTYLDKAARAAFARQADATFRLWASAIIQGERDWYCPIEKKRRKIIADRPLFFYERFRIDQEPLAMEGATAAPDGFTIVDSTLTKELRRHPGSLQQLGCITTIAQIPSGKTGGDWARSIALRLTGLARIKNQDFSTGEPQSFKRRTLLCDIPPNKDPQSYLDGNDPKRAAQYFRQAVDELKRLGLVEDIIEPAKEWGRGRAKTWLDETVRVILGPALSAPVSGIAAKGKMWRAKQTSKGRAV